MIGLITSKAASDVVSTEESGNRSDAIIVYLPELSVLYVIAYVPSPLFLIVLSKV